MARIPRKPRIRSSWEPPTPLPFRPSHQAVRSSFIPPIAGPVLVGQPDADANPRRRVNFSAVTPNSRNTPVETVSVNLSEAAGSGSCGASALTLTVNGGAKSNYWRVSVTQVSGSIYQISGLSSLTKAEGSYILTVNAGDMSDDGGNPGSGSVSTSWLMDTTPPTSTIVALPAETASTSFTVSATSTDPEVPAELGIRR